MGMKGGKGMGGRMGSSEWNDQELMLRPVLAEQRLGPSRKDDRDGGELVSPILQ